MSLHERVRDHEYSTDCFGCRAATLRVVVPIAYRTTGSGK